MSPLRIIIIIISLLLLLLHFPIISNAVTDPEKELKRIEKEIVDRKEKLKDAREKEHSILAEIQSIEKNLAILNEEITDLNKKVYSTERTIASLNSEIDKTRKILKKQQQWIKRKLIALNRLGLTGDAALLLLGSRDMSQFMRSWKYLERITTYEKTLLDEYKKNLIDLDLKITRQSRLKKDLIVTKAKIVKREILLKDEKESLRQLLASVKNEKSMQEKVIGELEEASKELQRIIERASRSQTYGDTEFARLKGKLIWPVAGNIAIPYGSHRDPQFNTPVFRTGIHISSASDSVVTAVHKGKVIFAEWFKGFGKLVIINHGGGYHSLYGNLSEIFLSVGDIIEGGSKIGRVVNSGVLENPGLYFEIRYEGKPLNPSQWLKK